MIEALEALHAGVEHIFASVPERRMAEIVGDAQAFGEIVIEPHHPRHAARDLRDLERVRQPGAVMIALMGDEHLGLAAQAPEGAGMDDAVAVALERACGVLLSGSACKRPRERAGSVA